MNAQAKYDTAMEAFRVASRAHDQVRSVYRARKIGDDEFLASRRMVEALSLKVDEAESELIAEAKKGPVFKGHDADGMAEYELPFKL